MSSQFDADRLDYMRRDRLMTGTQLAGLDFRWLIANLRIHEFQTGVLEKKTGSLKTFVLDSKALFAAEAYVLGLFQLYPTVYFHKATRCAELIFTELISRLIVLVRENQAAKTGLPKNHPLLRFARQPDDLKNFLDLDDNVVWGAMSMMASSKDEAISQAASRLRDRKLYKCLDVRKEVEQSLTKPGRKEPTSGNTRDPVSVCCARIQLRIESEMSQQLSRQSLLVDDGRRSPYKKVDEPGGAIESIYIQDGREAIDIRHRSKVVAALKPFEFLRVYTPEHESIDERRVATLIREEVERADV